MRKHVIAVSAVVAATITSTMLSPATAATAPPPGATYWAATTGAVGRTTEMMAMRRKASKVCFTQTLGYTFKGTRSGKTYVGGLQGPQLTTRQTVKIRTKGDKLTWSSKGRQDVEGTRYRRVTLSEAKRSNFGKDLPGLLNAAC